MKENFDYFDKYAGPKGDISIEAITDADETILWQGKPKASAFLCVIFAKAFGVLLFMGSILAVFFYVSYQYREKSWYWAVCTFLVLILITTVYFAFNMSRGIIEYKNLHYWVTDRRIIIRSGLVINYEFINYKEIESVNSEVNFISKLFKTGDIIITTKDDGSCFFYSIKKVYKVANFIQKIVLDIQTDIYFPNDLRPDENPGYNTEYQG